MKNYITHKGRGVKTSAFLDIGKIDMNKDNKNNMGLIKIYELLMPESDELHPMTTDRICTHLAESGIPCDGQILSRNIGVLN